MQNIPKRKITSYPLAALLIIIFIILFVQSLEKGGRADGNDFTSYLLASEALYGGENPYMADTPFHYIYPLFLAFVIYPLTLLNYNIAGTIWFIINIMSFWFSLYFLRKILSGNGIVSKHENILIFTLLLIILFEPVQNHLLNGQVNFIVLLLSVLFIYYLNKNPYLSSLFLAAAVSIKIVPAILFLYLIIEKRFKELAFTIALIFIFTLLLPYLAAGENVFQFYSYYFNSFIISSASGGRIEEFYFSVPGFLNNFNLKGTGYIIVSSVIVLIPLITVHIRRDERNNNLFLFAAYLTALLLITPGSQKHHLIFALPAAYLLMNDFNKKRLTQIALFAILLWGGLLSGISLLIFFAVMVLYVSMIYSSNSH
jgi:hypothetical protein